jgi:hypothetical protein
VPETDGCRLHTRARCDFDGEHDRLIQVYIYSDTRNIPHALRIAAAARAVDGWKRPSDLADRTQRGVYGPFTRLDQTRALVRLQPGSPNVNSALSKRAFAISREMAVRFAPKWPFVFPRNPHLASPRFSKWITRSMFAAIIRWTSRSGG